MNESIKEINCCEVCNSKNLVSVLNLGNLPMCDDLIPLGDTKKCKEYPTEIYLCIDCNTAHQRFQIKKEILFNDLYHYRARFTQDVIDGMEELVKSTKDYLANLKGKKVLDVGCNDGSLLNFFQKEGAYTFGIEPTDAYLDAKELGHNVLKDYLTPKVAENFVKSHGKIDILTFTNVFAHIDDLNELLKSVEILMHDNSVLVVENHYLGSILKTNQFDTFYHEHPRSYSFSSFKVIANTLERKISKLEFPSRYGGNIRVFIDRNKNPENFDKKKISKIEDYENSFNEMFVEMEKKINNWKKDKITFIDSLLEKHKRIAAKAFPGRAAILMRLLDLDIHKVLGVYEKPGSKKIGHYVPGTRIPILSDNDLFKNQNKEIPLMNLAWHIPEEVREYLKENNYHGEIFEIIETDDWK
jgi:SAM-dependent methyltransferase